MLKVVSIDASYNGLKALDQVSLDVNEGEFVALIGSNGAGKSTLIKSICGLLPPHKGQIIFEDKRIDKAGPHQIVNAGLVLIPEGRDLFPQMNVMENLLMGAFTKRARNDFKNSLEEVFKYFPILYERRYQLAQTLSGGEQQMLAIGRGLMAKPKLLILDEPSIGLAPRITKDIFSILEKLHMAKKVAILLSEQNIFNALKLASRGFLLENGKISLKGTSKELLDNDKIKCAYLGM